MSTTVWRNKWLWGVTGSTLSMALLSTLLYLFMPEAAANEEQGVTGQGVRGELAHWAYYMTAAVATGMSSIGAGIAVSQVGAASVAAIAEKPELLGRVLIILGLAEGIAIYGLIISFIIIAAL